MPTTLDPQGVGGTTGFPTQGIGEAIAQNYQYDYPIEHNLKPGTPKHNELVSKVMVRARQSMNVMSRRHGHWNEIDKVLRVYVPPDRKPSKERMSSQEKSGVEDIYDEGVPRIVMPETYATLETLLTYMTSAFFQDPIFTYNGQGPEDVLGAQLMTMVIDSQVKRNGIGLNLHTMFRDNFAYGIGPVSPVWKREFGTKTVRREFGFMDELLGRVFRTRQQRERTAYQLLYEGNDLINIDPYRFLPDPNVSAHEIQDGEFVGWIERTNIMSVLKRDTDDGDFLFNGRYLKHIDGLSKLFSDSTNRAQERMKARGRHDEQISTNRPVDIVWMYVDLIPREWELSESEDPETWLLGVGGDSILVAAQPLNLDHGQKPAAVACTEYDGYSPNPISRLGIVYDAQNLIDFLYTSHIQNVKKSINDMFIVDPSLVNIYDVANPKPGKLIRTRRAAWGRGQLDQAIKQFDVRDVTAGHVADANFLAGIMQRVTGSEKQMQGSLESRTTRVSASEAIGVRGGALSRLERIAQLISIQAMVPIGRMFASHVQQLMEEETYVKVVGEMEQRLMSDHPGQVDIQKNRLRVNPMDMIVDYDVSIHDGTIPGAENVQTWTELFQTISQSEELVREFDVVKIFKHIARQLGAKDVEGFERAAMAARPQVANDENVMRDVERGNLVPMNGQ